MTGSTPDWSLDAAWTQSAWSPLTARQATSTSSSPPSPTWRPVIDWAHISCWSEVQNWRKFVRLPNPYLWLRINVCVVSLASFNFTKKCFGVVSLTLLPLKATDENRILTVKLKIPRKSIFEIRNQNFYYIQVIVFDFSYLPVAAIWT